MFLEPYIREFKFPVTTGSEPHSDVDLRCPPNDVTVVLFLYLEPTLAGHEGPSRLLLLKEYPVFT